MSIPIDSSSVIQSHPVFAPAGFGESPIHKQGLTFHRSAAHAETRWPHTLLFGEPPDTACKGQPLHPASLPQSLKPSPLPTPPPPPPPPHKPHSSLVGHCFSDPGLSKAACKAAVLAEAQAASSVARELEMPHVQAEGWLMPHSLEVILPGLKTLLSLIAEQLEEDLELLSDKGRDRMFISASGILEKLNVLLALCETPSQADAQVCVNPPKKSASRETHCPDFPSIYPCAHCIKLHKEFHDRLCNAQGMGRLILLLCHESLVIAHLLLFFLFLDPSTAPTAYGKPCQGIDPTVIEPRHTKIRLHRSLS